MATSNPLLFLGGASAVFGSLMNPIINDRREDYFQKLLNDYERLTKKIDGFDFEKIIREPKVVDAIIQSSLIAIKTHQEEKRALLRNAVLNISQGINIEDDMQTMYFQWIDELTPTHIQLLSFFNEPSKWKNSNRENWQEKFQGTFNVNDYFSDKFPKIDEYEQYCRDLQVKRLFHILHNELSHEENEMWRKPLAYSWTSDLGKKFLEFIKNPI